MNITPISSTNFQGQLNLAGAKTNKARWNNVSKIFSEKTKSFQNAEIRICEVRDEMALEACLNNKKGWKNNIVAAMFTYRIQELFDNMTDNDIADILVKFLKLGDQGIENLSKARTFASNVTQKSCGNDNVNSKKIFDNIYEEASKLIKKEVFDKAKNDIDMQNWAVFLKG